MSERVDTSKFAGDSQDQKSPESVGHVKLRLHAWIYQLQFY